MLFEQLKAQLTSNRDLSFIYRRMEKDGLIKPELKQKIFIVFLLKNYNISIDKILTLNECKDKLRKKEHIYSLTKQLLKVN